MPAQIRPTEFELVVSQERTELNKKVNDLLGRGWVPHGDTKITWGSSAFTYTQAMVKLEVVNVNVPGIQGAGGILVPQ